MKKSAWDICSSSWEGNAGRMPFAKWGSKKARTKGGSPVDFLEELGKLTPLSLRRKNRIWKKAVTGDQPQS
jgi:hypothetical protein